jgi:hypothetical protein
VDVALDEQSARVYAVPLYGCVEEDAGKAGEVGNAVSWSCSQRHKDRWLAVLWPLVCQQRDALQKRRRLLLDFRLLAGITGNCVFIEMFK